MSAWQALDGKSHDKIWAKFEKQFKFKPTYRNGSQVYAEPTPSITYDIKKLFTCNDAQYKELNTDLSVKVYKAFRKCTPKGQKIYALDFHHPCYLFDVFADFDAKDEEAWKVPIMPNGDYYIFLASDFSFGILGHPWEHTLCIFGEDFISAIRANKPKVFVNNIVREKTCW